MGALAAQQHANGSEGPEGPGTTDAHSSAETTAGRVFQLSLFPALHLLSCTALAVCMTQLLDGYLAVSEDSPRTTGWGEFRLRVSDITTLVQAAVVVIRLLVGSWMGTVMWNCLFILLSARDQGLTLAQINRLWSFYLTPLPREPAAYRALVLLLLMVPQLLISPLLTGAVGWSEASERNPQRVVVKSGNPEVGELEWYYYSTTLKNRRASVERAAAYASIAWPGSIPDRRRARHIMHPGQGAIPVNSTVLNATVPCIQIHSITFPDGPPSRAVKSVADAARGESDRLSCIDDPPLAYFGDGTAVLFDPANLRPPYPPDDGREVPRPSDYLQTGTLTAVFFIIGPSVDNKPADCTNIAGNIFGLPPSPNVFSFRPAEGPFYRCYGHAVVNLTAGVATSPRSTYVSDQVVEAAAPDAEMHVRPGPWVREAVYLLPDTMSMLRRMNTAPLAMWHDLPGYLDRLIRYAYQANWDMLSHSFDTDVVDLQVDLYEPRLRASVSQARVFAWLGVGALLTVSAVLLLLWDFRAAAAPEEEGSRRRRRVVKDGVLAALLTDPSEVLRQHGGGLTGLSYLADGCSEEVGPLILEKNPESNGWRLGPRPRPKG